MKELIKKEKKDIIEWFKWLSNQWNSYETFVDFSIGNNPEEVAEKFIQLNRKEISDSFDSFDNEDLDVLDQLQKLTESESHVFKIIREQINFKKKVKFVDFKRKKY